MSSFLRPTPDQIRDRILSALHEAKGNRTHAAKALDISHSYLMRLIGRYLSEADLQAIDEAYDHGPGRPFTPQTVPTHANKS